MNLVSFLDISERRLLAQSVLKRFYRAWSPTHGWKSRSYAKSSFTGPQMNSGFHVVAQTSFFNARFYTLWAESGL